LSAENEGLELELQPLLANVSWPESQSPEVDRRHAPERSAGRTPRHTSDPGLADVH
jgi:hypothetical protein